MSLHPARIDALVERISKEVDAGLLPSCQLAVGLEGEVVFTATLGDAAPDTRYTIFSATKALVAAVMWQLLAEGTVRLDEPAATYVPEFGTNGKDVVTVEQLLVHTGGFATAPLRPALWPDRAARLEQMSRWRLNHEPGTYFEYHPTAGHWVLGEIVAAVDADLPEAVRRRVLGPLGLTRLQLGVPLDQQGDIATLVDVGQDPSADELQQVFGVSEWDPGEVTPDLLLEFNDPVARTVGVPGAGAVSTAADLARLYQAFLHDPQGLWDPHWLAEGTAHVRCTLPDPILRTPAMRTLGLIAAGDDGTASFRGMGHNVSSRAFGHNGAGGQIAWADPATGLSFAYLTNGLDRNFLREARRTSGIASRAASLTTPA